MESLLIEAKKDTPRIFFSKDENVFEVTGRSLPEDVIDFYTPVIKWVEKYVEDPLDETKIIFKLDYVNSTSSKMLAEVLEVFEKIVENGKVVKAEWHYNAEDDDIILAGQEFDETIEINFEFHPFY